MLTQPPSMTFLEAVFRYPGMYTLCGTYEEAIAFLEGYFSGAAKGNPYNSHVESWSAFRMWLAAKLAVSPSDVFTHIKSMGGSSQTALSEMLNYVEAFQAE